MAPWGVRLTWFDCKSEDLLVNKHTSHKMISYFAVDLLTKQWTVIPKDT